MFSKVFALMNFLSRLSRRGSESDEVTSDTGRMAISEVDTKTDKQFNGLERKASSSGKVYPPKPIPSAAGTNGHSPPPLVLNESLRRGSVPGTPSGSGSQASKAKSLRGTPRELEKYKIDLVASLISKLEQEKYASLTEIMIRKMSCEEMIELAKSLNACKSKLNTFSPDERATLQPRIEQGLAWLSQVKKEATFLDSIAENKPADQTSPNSPSTQDVLLLSAQSMVAIEELFVLILKEIQTKADKESPRGITVKLLLFCQRWITHNKGTTLLPLAVPSLHKIIQETQAESHTKVKEHSERVLKALQDSTRASPEPLRYPQLLKDFVPYTSDLPESMAQKVADDLFCYQAYLFCQIQRDHLISAKWNERPQVVEQITKLQNGITNYLISLLLKEPSLEKRIYFVRFFLKVEQLALDKHDIPTAFAISTVWIQGPVMRLKSTFARFTTEIKNQEWVSSPNGHFSALKEHYNTLYKKFKEKSKSKYAHIPLLNLIPGNLERIDRAEPKVVELPDDGPQYNLLKLVHILSYVEGVLKPQAALRKKPEESLFQTNFVANCLAHKPLTDTAMYELAEKLASPTSSPREGK